MILAVAIKFFRHFYRNKISFAIVFGFPFFFLWMFSFAFGGNVISSSNTYNLAIINNDEGISEDFIPFLPSELSSWFEEGGAGMDMANIMYNLSYAENNNNEVLPIFNEIEGIQTDQIQISVDEHITHVIVVIPENFTLSLLNIINNQAGQQILGFPTDVNAEVLLYGDEQSNSYVIASSIVSSVFNQYITAIEEGDLPSHIRIEQQIVIPGETRTFFDFIAPGIYVFASVLSAVYFVGALLNDTEQETLDRIKISNLGAHHYILGFLLMSSIILSIQTAFLFIAAQYGLNFNPIGSVYLAYGVMLLLMFATYGLVFLGAAVFNNTNTSGASLGFLTSIIALSSGSFIPMPEIVIFKDILKFTSGSPHFLIWDFLPWTHAVNALRAVLLFDRGIEDVIGDIYLMVIFGVFWFMVSLTIYTRRRFALR